MLSHPEAMLSHNEAMLSLSKHEGSKHEGRQEAEQVTRQRAGITKQGGWWEAMERTLELMPPAQSDAEVGTRLTEREREILRLIFEGKCSSDVADILCVSKRTVDFHLARAYVKLGVSNRFQAFKRAMELGIISS